jgi:hypothetical protein
MRRALLLALLSLLPQLDAIAAELTPFVAGGQVGIVIGGLDYPQNLPQDLRSGLTNRMLIRAELLDGTRVVREHRAQITVRFDLWDENFTVVSTIGEVAQTKVLPDIAAVNAFLASIELRDLFASTDLTEGREFSIRAQLLLNPIERERMDKIRKWVADNSTHAATDPTGAGSGSPVGASTSGALFNRIFEQYAAGADVAGIWQESVASPPFRPEELRRDRP